MLTHGIASSRRVATRRLRALDTIGLVAAIGPDLTGRVHHAYRRQPDRRWWRRWHPGRKIPGWDYVSLCGRQGLVPAASSQPVDCISCQRIVDSRPARLARSAGRDA